MSTGSHLSRNLANLIRTIGQTRSKEQQDQIIRHQVNMLRVSLTLNPKEQDYFEIMIKMLYIETLGHDADFAHIYPVNLCQSKSPKIKRLAYLLTTLCINRNSKLSILMLSTIQKDLNSSNLNSIIYCLTALPKIINKTIIEGSLQSLLKLLKHPTDLVRKKTLLVLQKIYEIQPEVLPTFKTILQQALVEDEPVVSFTAALILKNLILKSPEQYKEMTDIFCKLLKDIVQHKYPKQYDYHKVPAPWMQIEVLKILEALGRNDHKSSSKMYDILEKTLRRATYNQMHINNSIVVQCIKTVSCIYPNLALIRQSQNFMWRFFEKENNNLKAFGINTLMYMVKIEPGVVRNWQYVILECLDSGDTTLAAITINLLIQIANEENTTTILEKLMSLAEKSTDYIFQLKIIKKSLLIIERFSSEPLQYIKRMNQMLIKFQKVIDDKSLNGYIRVLIEAIDTNQNFDRTLVEEYENLLKFNKNKYIVKVGTWFIGEYATKCYKDTIEEQQRIDELTMLLISLIESCEQFMIESILTSLFKLTHYDKFRRHEQMKEILCNLEKHANHKIHSKAEEFIRLAKFASALTNSKNIVIDRNLSFLDDFVNSHKQIKSISVSSAKKPISPSNELNMQPYPLQTTIVNRRVVHDLENKSTFALVQMQDDAVLKFNGPKKWTSEGYMEKNQATKQQVPSTYVVNSKPEEHHELKLKGPMERKSNNLQKEAIDQRKINLAKSIFTK